MICASSECDSDDIKVIDSRPHESKNWVRRRRVQALIGITGGYRAQAVM